MKTPITVEIDTDKLPHYVDSYLAQLWHVAQANPAAYADRDAGKLAAAIGFEIIRRWLAAVPVELYHHQPTHSYSEGLHAVGAKFINGSWQIPTAQQDLAP